MDQIPSKRIPPFSEDAEQAVLSAMMIDPGALLEARAIARAESFYVQKHRTIFRALVALSDANTIADPVTLANELQRTGDLERIGGKEYIGWLTDAIPTAANVVYHARIVAEKSAQRDLIVKLDAAVKLAWTQDRSAEDIAKELVADFLPLATPNGGAGYVLAGDVIYGEVLQEIERRSRVEGLIGVPTGYAEIDDETGGWREGELFSVCGVPGSGKSVLLQNFLANNVAHGVDCGIVTLEMTRAAVLERMLSNFSRVEARAIRNGRLDAAAWKNLMRAAQRLRGDRGGRLFIDDTPNQSLRDVVVRARGLKIRNPSVRVIYVDYLQLMSDDDGETRAEELRAISNGLQQLGKELGIPIGVAAQLADMKIEARADKRPQRADVQGSSGLRQAASYLGLLYRPSMYEPRTHDWLEIDFAKTRSSKLFMVQLEADMAHMRVKSSREFEPVHQRQEELGVHT